MVLSYTTIIFYSSIREHGCIISSAVSETCSDAVYYRLFDFVLFLDYLVDSVDINLFPSSCLRSVSSKTFSETRPDLSDFFRMTDGDAITLESARTSYY